MTDTQKDTIGATFVITVVDETGTAIDYSDATTLNIIFGVPDGTTLTKTAAFTTTGTDGKIQYVSIANDLTPAGTWTIQGRLRKTGLDVYTEIGTFTVNKNIE